MIHELCQNPQSGGASGNNWKEMANRKVSNSRAKGDSAFQLPALGWWSGPVCRETEEKGKERDHQRLDFQNRRMR